ncbi:TPA: hypothetical protein N0F65_003967 [Lagenidium giganteum]|uniref:ADP-ribosylation factor-like protein 6 n=1 Tax=Lagenidium giganteum TaxID=4803 RepID=A0AAV2YYP9_9STRA|nr:TPA: hypothetical protein N0F65_003967 [Lagenidium giganteum]
MKIARLLSVCALVAGSVLAQTPVEPVTGAVATQPVVAQPDAPVTTTTTTTTTTMTPAKPSQADQDVKPVAPQEPSHKKDKKDDKDEEDEKDKKEEDDKSADDDAAEEEKKDEKKTPKATPAPAPKEPVRDAKWYWENEDDPRFVDVTGDFKNFVPNDTNQTCSHDRHATPFNKQVRGANLGGWLVLEPWITPTLFYQFLGTQEHYGDLAPNKTAMDSYTFCTALGKEEANRQLRIHWANWVTEDDIKEMAEAGVNSLRVPVGDWMFTPYEPYIGCTDGAVEELDRVADLAQKYGIDLLIDIHGLIGSQNGFDNSGKTSAVKWTSIASTQPVGTTTFEHWPIRMAEWAGTYDPNNHNYSSINYANLNQSLAAVTAIVERYASHPAILGLQPVNEPWELTPIKVLKDYYWKSYKRVKVLAPHWKFVLHDSFRFGLQYWSQFMKGCPDIALDTHIYQAWMNPGTKEDFYSNACQQKYTISNMENALMPVIVGEWSLATDNCAMWLNGFNDNLPGFPKVICTLKKCPLESTYLGEGFPGTPLDPTKPIQGPYGTGTSGPSFGLCPVNSNVSFGQSDDHELTRNLATKKLNAFALGHGWYFWNFKTELDTKWNFMELIRKGVFPKNVSSYTDEDGVSTACEREDKGDFVCAAKRGVHRYELENGLKYACNAPNVNCTDIEKRFLTLVEQCDYAFNAYWHAEREKGATCDFGGAAHLLEIQDKSPRPTPHAISSPAEVATRAEGSASSASMGTSALGIVAIVVAASLPSDASCGASFASSVEAQSPPARQHVVLAGGVVCVTVAAAANMGMFKQLTNALGIKKTEVRILVVGLDNSGKTTLINHLKPKKSQNREVVPTIGFQVEEFSKSNLSFTVFDMSGQSRYRSLWENYYSDVQAIIFVLDSTDTIRMCVAKDELEQLVEHKDLAGKKIPILFFANKMDLANAMTPVECMEQLELEKLPGKSWHITASNAITGRGVEEGIDWLAEQFAKSKSRK